MHPGSSSASFAAADLENAHIYPFGEPTPSWATLYDGTPVGNEAITSTAFKPFQAPNFVLRGLDGDVFTLSSHRGKVIILNFFGVGCGPCLRESPYLADLQEKYRDHGLLVASINAWNDWELPVKKYAKKAGLADNTVVLLRGKSVAEQFDVEGVPRTFWINRDGVVIDSSSGFREEDQRELDARTRRALSLN